MADEQEKNIPATPENNSAVENDSSSADGGGEPTGLLKALESEREARKRLEKEIKERNRREQELNEKLERAKQIDPERYEKLIKEQQEREEQDLLKKRQFEELKQRYLQESESAKREAMQWQERHNNVVVETAIKTAFFDNGGRRAGMMDENSSYEDVAPVEAILSLLRPRIKLDETGKVLIIDRVGTPETNEEGRPKTLTEKMLELRKGSMAALFEPENNNSGGGMFPPSINYKGRQTSVYSKDAARSGKAKIEDIATGKAIVQ